MQNTKIALKNVSKIYHSTSGSIFALKNISLDIACGEIVGILGLSGSGKTTLINLIAGYLTCSSGEIRVDNKLIHVPAKDRVTIFQTDALFPHLRLIDNVSFGLIIQGFAKNEAQKISKDILCKVGLERRVTAYPKECSIGERKRTELVRAFVVRPPVLLADEPFANLDIYNRKELQEMLLELWQKSSKGGDKTTIVFSTHDVVEAACLSNRIIMLPLDSENPITDIKVPFPNSQDIRNLYSSEFNDYTRHLKELLLLNDE